MSRTDGYSFKWDLPRARRPAASVSAGIHAGPVAFRAVFARRVFARSSRRKRGIKVYATQSGQKGRERGDEKVIGLRGTA